MKKNIHILLSRLLGTMTLSCFIVMSCGGNSAHIENSGGGNENPPPAPPAENNVIYAAADGYDTGTGTIGYPYKIHKAIQQVAEGGTIYVRGGTYRLTERINLEKIGTAEKPYKLFAYQNEKPVFDFIDMTGNNPGIRIDKGCYWHVKGIEVRNAYGDGIKILDGCHNTFENCSSHHNGGTGFNLGGYGHEVPGQVDPNPDGAKAAFNSFINCDAYLNFDWYTVNDGNPEPGTNADGFGVKMSAGPGNKFVGCRAWSNSDDAWDFYECGYAVQVIGCWAWRSGIWSDYTDMYRQRTGQELTESLFDGNGNGFKIGGGCLHNDARVCNAASRGTHVVRNCISFGHPVRGFDQNNHEYGAWIEHCVGFGNGTNFAFWRPNKNGTGWQFRNNISFGGQNADRFVTPGVVISADEGNSWNLSGLDPAKFADQFVSLSTEDAAAPRLEDGSLPARFGRLKPGSFFIDRGVPTRAIQGDVFQYPPNPYKGEAPDPGAFEY